MSSIDPRLQPAGQYPPPRTAPPPSHPTPQQPLNPSAYASSNPIPRLARAHPAPDSQPYPQHHGVIQQPYYATPPRGQSQIVGTTTPTQRYDSPHYRGSAPSDDQDTANSPTDGNDANDPKRSRACESCRGLKVRCDQDPENPNAPCKRCAKADRQCIVTAPSRKRQKKTDSRVAELEKKIELLTASITAQNPNSIHGPDANSHRYPPGTMSSPESTHSYESHSSRRTTLPHRPSRELADGKMQKRPLSTGLYDKKTQSQSTRQEEQPIEDREDPETLQYVVSTLNGKVAEIIDERTGAQIFDRYVMEMAMHMPAVVFPSQTTAHQIRRSKPILFLSIMVAGSVGLIPMDTQEVLVSLLKTTLADCVIRFGGKSMELVQALFIAVAWYRPPRLYEQMNFYQLTHIAAVMAVDIGLGKRMNVPRNQRLLTGSEQTTRIPKFLLNPTTVEARRTWLGCYFLCSNTSMTLRRPNMIRWSSYMDECIEALETSDAALPTDRLLCQFVKLQHINEEVGQQFSMDDPSATITFADRAVEDALKRFENQLKEWSNVASTSSAWNHQLEFNEHVTAVYMHEVALHINHNVDDFRAPFTEESLKAASGQSIVLSEAHSKALMECLTSVHACFHSFFNFDMTTIKALPIFYFVRIAYAVVVLIKLFFAVTAPGSQLGKIMSQEDLQVEYYIDALLRILHSIDDDEAFRPARMFLLILTRLRQWFQTNRANRKIPGDASRFNPWASARHAEDSIKERPTGQEPSIAPTSDPVRSTTRAQQAATMNDDSPLNVLAQVVTDNSNSNVLSMDNNPASQMQGLSPAQQQNSSYYQGGMTAPPQGGYDSVGMVDNNEYNMGIGFAQALDMTMGSADQALPNFFYNDPMFNFGVLPDGNSMHYFSGQGW